MGHAAAEFITFVLQRAVALRVALHGMAFGV